MPVAISFTLETDGRLPSGMPLADAIAATDDATGGDPAYYMINCAHPTHFERAIRGDARVRDARPRPARQRVETQPRGARRRARTSTRVIRSSSARSTARCASSLPRLTVVGGCCGTDHRHVDAIGAAPTALATCPATSALAPSALCRTSALEHRHRLDVRRVRKHVDDARRREAIAAFVHEHRGVARERRRVARHVDESRERALVVAMRQRLRELDRAFARRVDQRAVERTERCRPIPRVAVNRFAATNERARARPLRAAFSCAWRTSAALPSTPTTVAPLRAIGSVKLPRPQKKSATRSPGCGASSASARRTSTRLTPKLTCVKSVGRERQRDVELGQRVGQRRILRMERRDGARPAGLQPERRRRACRRTRRACASSVGDGGSSTRSTSAYTRRPGRRRRAARRRRPRSAAAGRGSTATRRACAAAPAGRTACAAARGIRACRRRSSTAARGSRPARRPSSARAAPTAARGSDSPTARRRSGGSSVSGRDAADARERILERALLRRDLQRRRRRAAACSRRTRRNAGSAASRATRSRARCAPPARYRSSACA